MNRITVEAKKPPESKAPCISHMKNEAALGTQNAVHLLQYRKRLVEVFDHHICVYQSECAVKKAGW
jgi:hypothetical protein